jgi:hypothetical protein
MGFVKGNIIAQLTFTEEDTVTVDVKHHGRFMTTRNKYEDNKDMPDTVVERILRKAYDDMDLELTPDLPHEVRVVMLCEIDPYGNML